MIYSQISCLMRLVFIVGIFLSCDLSSDKLYQGSFHIVQKKFVTNVRDVIVKRY